MARRQKDVKRPVGMRGPTVATGDWRVMMTTNDFGTMKLLGGHSLRWAAQEESTPGMASLVEYNPRTGKNEIRQFETERKYVMKRDVEIGIPNWGFSPLEEVVFAGVDNDYLRVRSDCPYCDREAFVYTPQTALKEIVDTENLAMGGIDPQNEAIGKTTGFNLNSFADIKGIAASIVSTPATALYAVAWQNPNYCGTASECPGDVIIGGGAIGAEVDEILATLTTTTNRFDTETGIGTGLAAGMEITDLLVVGNVTFATWSDTIDPSTAADGGVLVYKNGVATEAQSGGSVLNTPMFGICIDGDDRVIAVGQDGAIFTAKLTNPLVFTDISIAAETSDLVSIASGGSSVSYIAASDGTAFSLVGNTTQDISTVVKDGLVVSQWTKVESLGYGHVMFGGENGTLSETLDDGTTWDAQQINLGAGDVGAIGGWTYRTFVTIGTSIFERSPLALVDASESTQMDWREVELEGGQEPSGNITDIAVLWWLNGPNNFAFVTDDGEVGYAKACVASC